MTIAPRKLEKFKSVDAYQVSASVQYKLMPFRFIHLDGTRYFLSNLAGEHIVLEREDLYRFARKELVPHSPIYNELKSRHFLYDDESNVALDLVSLQYRTKQSHHSQFTSLHLFVVTLRCDHSCPYCQVSRQSEDRHAFDMSVETANKAIDFLFKSPSPALKVEFQGGEALLNFEMVRYIVLEVKLRNVLEKRDVEFVIASNLSPLNDEILAFCKEQKVLISTSLDGPAHLHNRNRPRPGNNSHELAVAGIQKVREVVGLHCVAALMTTTRDSLDYPKEIIDEYVQMGFRSIFLRPISPYGFAVKTSNRTGYDMERWLSFYRMGLDYIIDLNKRGIPFLEEYTALILRKLLTPFPTGYVDLQSPAGLGISVVVFNYDADVYATDESRMLAEMGDKTFRLGNLHTDSYEEIFSSDFLVDTLSETVLEGMPGCTDCALLPYCGSDPVYHHATQGDKVGHKPTSDFCTRNMEVIKHIVRLLEDHAEARRILETWI